MQRAPLEDAARVVAAIEGSDAPETLQALVRECALPLGYDRFVLYSADIERDEVIAQLFWLEGDWFGEGGEVDAKTYLARCPVTRHVLETDEPFFWSKTGNPGAETYRVVVVPRGRGIHGLQVPIFAPAGLVGAMSFGGKRIDSSTAARLLLTLVGTAALRTAKRLAGLGGAAAPHRLSPREREVIRWIASGRKQSDTALLLGLSERTVENHLRRIRNRLGASSTAQAVLMAVQTGEIES
ncbi:PA1136 family autoinducer-binding transcriptional regulator [Azospirillum canadense]|uniref:PA1136 family autoinducer-binding transcriptional regulator n=1 Tax=Azospirillum canadense TaxID=403962 RepID=UPI0022280DA5|nr:PA1136 family autoinducer-binding transcriptional regulator [Azospirillum canadense]MCW2240638.1 LuxR family transcriptional regulator (chaperone HchA-associated) [Azospirillum canadense]